MDTMAPVARLPNRFVVGALIVGLFAWAGPAIGALGFVVDGAIHLSFHTPHVTSFSGQGVLAMLFFWPVFLIGSYVTALIPATTTGGVFAVELIARGRVSWLTAVLAPIVCIWVYRQIHKGFDLYPFGLVASLSLRLLCRNLMNGSQQLAPVNWTGWIPATPRWLATTATGWRSRIFLTTVLATPIPTTIVFFAFSPGAKRIFPDIGPGDAFGISCFMAVASAAVLLVLARRARGVRLAEAALASTGAWGLILLVNIARRGVEPDLMLLALVAVGMFVGVAWVGRHWLGWGPTSPSAPSQQR